MRIFKVEITSLCLTGIFFSFHGLEPQKHEFTWFAGFWPALTEKHNLDDLQDSDRVHWPGAYPIQYWALVDYPTARQTTRWGWGLSLDPGGWGGRALARPTP